MLDTDLYRTIVDVMPIVCVDLVVRLEGKRVLLVKRANEPAKDEWWLPGGRILKGETLETAAHRKALEELGTDVWELQPLGYYERHWATSPFGLKSGHHTISFVFQTNILDGTPVILDNQSKEWRFADELPSGIDLKPFANLRSMIQEKMLLAKEQSPFVYGKTRIPLSVPTYGVPEVIEAMNSLTSTMVTMGKKVRLFEEMFARYVGTRYAIMTNSGSSANLLALTSVDLQPGDEIITPALTWATTVFPIAQVGAIPVLVDVDRETYNISIAALEKAITPSTRAIMPVHLLGNPCDMDVIMGLADRHHLSVIEDACEAHGAEYHGDYPARKVGGFGDISTFSFFFSHHISTIEGGMILTNDMDMADICRSLRAHGWIREMGYSRRAFIDQHPDIDPRFLFAYPGYNFRPTEIAGAFGIHQLPRLDGLVELRRQNAAYFNAALSKYEGWLMLPHERPDTKHSYFAYPITVKEHAPFRKADLVAFLEGKGLETRPIESGNMALQPAMTRIKYRIDGTLNNADYIHRNGFFFGNHQGLGLEEREAIVGYFNEFMQRYE